jgi:hypothetical protein
MTLETARFLQNTDNGPEQYHDEIGWRQIGAGLRMVSIGYCVLIVGGSVCWALIRLTLSGQTFPSLAEEADQPFVLAWLIASSLVVTAVCSYGLVMLGHFRCMLYAPRRHCAKEVMYVCFQCLLVGSVLNGVGVYLDDGKTFAALQLGWEGVRILNPWSTANLMHLASLVLWVVSALVFSQYLRKVAECFDDRSGVNAVDLNLFFMCLMIGGSVGVCFCVGWLKLKGVTLVWLAAGWVLCLIWHLWLVLCIRRCVYDGLRKDSEEQIPPCPTGAIHTSTLSGLHRRAKETVTEGEAWLW